MAALKTFMKYNPNWKPTASEETAKAAALLPRKPRCAWFLFLQEKRKAQLQSLDPEERKGKDLQVPL